MEQRKSHADRRRHPPNRRGLQPQLGLAYSTGSDNGVLGWGWSIGVPFISQQSDKGLPRYNSSDRFMYNGGQELVPIAMPTTPKTNTSVKITHGQIRRPVLCKGFT